MQVNATNDGFLSSHDGTAIAYQRSGHGPPLILVGGGLDDGGEHAPLAAALSNAFTVYNYARRGRGPSGNTLPVAVAQTSSVPRRAAPWPCWPLRPDWQ